LALHLLVDANLSPALADLLPQRLSDVRAEHVLALGCANAADDRVIALARDRNAILLTEDRGFDTTRNPICTHPGVVIVPTALAFPEVVSDLLRRIWLDGYRTLLDHAITRLERDRVRVIHRTGETVLIIRGQRLHRV
jgi:predicted nuclease of predicted toxin-antitoxin system